MAFISKWSRGNVILECAVGTVIICSISSIYVWYSNFGSCYQFKATVKIKIAIEYGPFVMRLGDD